MAGTDGSQTPALKEHLLSEGHCYSFVQAYRLLGLLLRKAFPMDAKGAEERILVRPNLCPEPPDAEVVSITPDAASGQETYTITAPFPSLGAVASPGPAFYAEGLPEQASAQGAKVRESLESVAGPFYRLFFDAWAEHRPFYGVLEKGCGEGLERLVSLIGSSVASLRGRVGDPLSLIFCLGPATQMPRSAEGLRAFLAGFLSEPTVRIEECVPRTVAIPEDQLISLGVRNHCLGQTAYCGRNIEDRTGQFAVIVGPVGEERFQAFLPDSALFGELQEGIRIYLDQPLDWYLLISIEPSKVRAARLGEAAASRLGWNTWLSPGAPPQAAAVRLTPKA